MASMTIASAGTGHGAIGSVAACIDHVCACARARACELCACVCERVCASVCVCVRAVCARVMCALRTSPPCVRAAPYRGWAVAWGRGGGAGAAHVYFVVGLCLLVVQPCLGRPPWRGSRTFFSTPPKETALWPSVCPLLQRSPVRMCCRQTATKGQAQGVGVWQNRRFRYHQALSVHSPSGNVCVTSLRPDLEEFGHVALDRSGRLRRH